MELQDRKLPNQVDNRPSKWIVGLEMLPFLQRPLLLALVVGTAILFRLDTENYRFDRIMSGWMMLMVLLFVVTLVVGWVKGLPIWSLPYWVFGLTALVDPSGVLLQGQMMMELVDPNRHDPPSGWVIVLALITLVTMLLFRPSLAPLRSLFERVRQDITLPSFLIYCLSPYLLEVTFRGMFYLDMSMGLLDMILAAGAYSYLRYPRRMRGLVIASLLTWSISAVTLHFAWQKPVLAWMQYPLSPASPLVVTLSLGAVMVLLILLPEMIHRSARASS